MSASLMFPAVSPTLIRRAADVSSGTEVRADQMSRFFELSIDLFCIAGFDGYFKVLNRAWEDTLGYSRDELLGKAWLDFIHPDDREASLAESKKLAHGGRVISFENRYRCKDGSYKWFLWNSTAMPEQGVIYATARDITDRRNAEQALQQAHNELEARVQERTAELAKSNDILLAEVHHCREVEKSLWEAEEKYRSIFENAIEGIFQSTPDGTYINVNPALARMKGYESADELIAGVDDIGQQSYVDPNRRLEFKSLMEQHGMVTAFEYEIFRKDGKKVWLSMNARAVRSSSGQVLYYEGTVSEITARKQLEDQLRLAQKMEAVGQLAGGIAHDFNNLLGVIIGHAELLLENLGSDSPFRHRVEQINRASQSAAALVGQLLAFSRQQPVEPKLIDLNPVVADTTKMLGSVMGSKIALNNLLDPALWRIKADPNQIERVIVNLVMNARDAMPSGGQLTIETCNVSREDSRFLPYAQVSPGPYVMLAVTDTGIGMDAVTQSHIFEPFFTTKGRGKGLGLGLSTVYGSVKGSGGSITVRSEPGKGTTFRILLPAVSECEQENHALSAGSAQSVDGTETVLLVEDDSLLRELILGFLTRSGYTVLEAANAQQALSVARRFHHPIHLLLSDVVMPGLSGPKMAEELTSLHTGMKVLYMSGYREFDDDNEIQRQGKPLLQKPFTQKDLARKIREILATN